MPIVLKMVKIHSWYGIKYTKGCIVLVIKNKTRFCTMCLWGRFPPIFVIYHFKVCIYLYSEFCSNLFRFGWIITGKPKPSKVIAIDSLNLWKSCQAGRLNRNKNDFFIKIILNYRAMLCIRGTGHVPVSGCLSQVGVLLKRLNVGSHKQHHTIAQGL